MPEYNIGDVFIIKSIHVQPDNDPIFFTLNKHLENTIGIITTKDEIEGRYWYMWYSNADKCEYGFASDYVVEVIS